MMIVRMIKLVSRNCLRFISFWSPDIKLLANLTQASILHINYTPASMPATASKKTCSSFSSLRGCKGGRTCQRGNSCNLEIKNFRSGGAGGYRSMIERAVFNLPCTISSDSPCWCASHTTLKSSEHKFANAVMHPAAECANA